MEGQDHIGNQDSADCWANADTLGSGGTDKGMTGGGGWQTAQGHSCAQLHSEADIQIVGQLLCPVYLDCYISPMWGLRRMQITFTYLSAKVFVSVCMNIVL